MLGNGHGMGCMGGVVRSVSYLGTMCKKKYFYDNVQVNNHFPMQFCLRCSL